MRSSKGVCVNRAFRHNHLYTYIRQADKQAQTHRCAFSKVFFPFRTVQTIHELSAYRFFCLARIHPFAMLVLGALSCSSLILPHQLNIIWSNSAWIFLSKLRPWRSLRQRAISSKLLPPFSVGLKRQLIKISALTFSKKLNYRGNA